MRFVDISHQGDGPEVELLVAPAAELLLAIGVLLDRGEWGTYDLDTAWLTQLDERIDTDLRGRMQQLTGGWSKQMINLLPLVLRAEAPRGIDELVAVVKQLDAVELGLCLLGAWDPLPVWASPGEDLPVDREDVRQALLGNHDAQARVRAMADDKGSDEWCEAITTVFSLELDDLPVLLVEVIEAFDREVFSEVAGPALASIDRDVAAKRKLLTEQEPLKAIEEATNGLRLAFDDEATVALMPSFVMRPWMIAIETTSPALVVYPIADESVEIDPSEPSPQLMRLVKALSDERRLRLLRRLVDSPLSLTEAAEAMGVSKPTAHHHLAALRHAGLVAFEPRGREKIWSLRGNAAERAGTLLERYLGAG